MTPYIYDIAVIIIMLASIGIGYKRGILRVLLNLICFIIAFSVASVASSPTVTNAVYDNYLHEIVAERIDEAVDNTVNKSRENITEIIDAQISDTPLSEFNIQSIRISDFSEAQIRTLLTNPEISDKIKDIVKQYGDEFSKEINTRLPVDITGDDIISDENAMEVIISQLLGIKSYNEAYSSITDYIEKIVIRPIIIRFIGIVIWAAVFAVINFILHIIVRVIMIIRNVPPIKACDSLLGAVLGAVSGAAVIMVLCILIVLFVKFTGGMNYMNDDFFENTICFKWIYDFVSDLGVINRILA